MMEGHKLRYLQEYLERVKESSVGKYVEAMEVLEEPTRNCYAGHVELSRDEFVEMMLLDGILIMELLRKFRPPELRKIDILQLSRIRIILVQDILLFENQLPLFFLNRLSDMTKEPHFSVEGDLWTCLYKQVSFIRNYRFTCQPTAGDLHHLLGVMRSRMRPSFLDRLGQPIFFVPKLTKCATKLQEAGIKLTVAFSRDSLLDIDFKMGIVTIPWFCIKDDFEIFFRNLIAYELYAHENEWAYGTNYMEFMNNLIKSPKDVKILRQCGILASVIPKYAVKLRSTVNDIGINAWPNGGIVGAYGWPN
ncbi:unnamed protein product [Ilex paraguariensis]|uniref:Uncharacterized protein n=1 Tax=Ilex paraguariensis TaxID=185542 RepID=A0ABC8UWP7_9AQUA